MQVGPVIPSNPFQDHGNQSLRRSGSASRQEVLLGQLDPGLAGWCTLAARCVTDVEAEEFQVSKWLHRLADLGSLL